MFGQHMLLSNGGWLGAQYWRFRSITSHADFWDLRSLAGKPLGLFESADLTGVSLTTGLTGGVGGMDKIQWQDSAGVPLSGKNQGPVYQGTGNPFTNNAASFTYFRYVDAGDCLWLDFGAPKVVGSVHYAAVTGLPSRQPILINLQYSLDNSLWVSYCTLTNASSHNFPKWVNIIKGGTVAALAG